MGTQDAEINALAAVRQPLFICGEPGTGKEQTPATSTCTAHW